MENKIVSFKQFDDEQFAVEISEELKSKGIPNQIRKVAEATDDYTRLYFGLKHVYQIEVQSIDLNKTILSWNEMNKIDMNDFPKDYYLFSFTDEELLDILKNPKDWGEIDFNLSQQLLKKRNVDFDIDFLNGIL